MKKEPPRQPTTRAVVELTKAEVKALEKKLSLPGRRAEMNRETGLPYSTIRNVLQNGYGELPTIEKVRAYMAKENAGTAA